MLEIYTAQKDKSIYHKMYLFYPFRLIGKWWYNRKVKKHFSEIGMPINTCEGCGEGIVEWAIKDPNNPKIDMFVCNHCVGFYDINSTKRRLEIHFRMQKMRTQDEQYIRWDRSRPERRDSWNR